jgi:hypothetical protein
MGAPRREEKFTLLPTFRPQLKSGRWFVSVETGNGPDSHIGDFATASEAKNWIAKKSKYWLGRTDSSQ